MLKALLRMLVRHDVSWFILKPFSNLGCFMARARNEIQTARSVEAEDSFYESLFGTLFLTRKVLHGPFHGLQYPSYNSVGSTLYPKLIGSYERELQGVIESLVPIKFSEIINIGCGEGYYAIGLCKQFKNASIIACDTDPQAIILCKKMAELNQVTDRVTFRAELTAADLAKFEFTERGLIICDCEGFEKTLFNSSNLGNLKNCYLLIETHDFIDITISGDLIDLFSSTHVINIIKSIDDIEKVRLYSYEEAENFTLATKLKLFSERRPAIMEWLYLTPKDYESNVGKLIQYED